MPNFIGKAELTFDLRHIEESFGFFSSLRSDDLRQVEESFGFFSSLRSDDLRQVEESIGFFSSLRSDDLREKKLFLDRQKNVKKRLDMGREQRMEDVLITEHAGTKRDEISRYYQYGSGGVRVLDAKKTVKRLYLFDPASDIMTERDPRRQEKVLRRFIFDRYGMLEETFAFGERPRTFRYENGGRQIAVREGGEYGAVGKIFTFEKNGITETVWGRHGEIERVYQLDSKGDAMIQRPGGWYGNVDRTIVFAGMEASSFLEPEAFLQFLMFSEWSARDRDESINDRVTEIRGGEAAASGRNLFAYTGNRQAPAGPGSAGGKKQVPQRPARASRGGVADAGIDFIPDGDMPARQDLQGPGSRPSSEISFAERRHRDRDGGEFLKGKSAEIPLEERFGSSQREPKKLSKGKSAEIPYEERRGGRDR